MIATQRARPKTRAPRTRALPLAFLLPALAAGLTVLAPLAYLVLRALEAQPAELVEIVFRPRNLALLGNTLALTGGVIAATAVMSLPLAWLTARSDLPGRNLLVLLGVLPLAVPGYIGAYALLGATGEGGFLSDLTGTVWARPSGYLGALGVLSFFTFPYMFLNAWSALRGLDPALEEAGRSLGLSQRAVLARVVLPQLRPALASGALVVGLHVLGDFGVVTLTRFETFSYAVYIQYTAAFDRVYAAWLALIMLVITGAALAIEARFLRGTHLSRVGSGSARHSRPVPLGPWRYPAYAYTLALGAATLLVPLATILHWLERGLERGAAAGLAGALANSVQAAAPAALLATALALPVAYLAVRYPASRARWLERSAYLGYATPPLALALAFVFFALRAAPILYQTLALLIIAYVVHFLAEAIGPLRSALHQAPARLEEAARGLGRTASGAFWQVTFPITRAGVLASLAFVFLSALKELPLTFLLSPIGFNTLATTVWAYAAEGQFAEAAPYALAIVLASGAFTGLLLARQRPRGSQTRTLPRGSAKAGRRA
ncbi:MAG TPA: iron ABC transporter permease [Deinococcales bacterium]|nr:iron ABC transporter permease [Deinococcales bacterium]